MTMWVLIATCSGLISWWLSGRLVGELPGLSALDHPNERSLHTRPTPRSGGLGILGGILIGLSLAAVAHGLILQQAEIFPKGIASASLWIVGSIGLISAVSFFDDRRGLPVGLRFIAQVVAAGIIVWGVGLKLTTIPIPLLESIELSWLSGPISMLFLLWMTNLYNFMDGMDGFAGGMTAVGFAFIAYFGWWAGHPFMVLIAAAISASASGFVIHNFPPAKIFMGDVGSIPLGFAAGTLVLLGVRDGLFDFWVPMLIFSPFILDATVTVLRRAWQGCRIWEAHREHYYQRLILSGWSHRRTVLIEYLIMLCCGGLAVLYHHSQNTWRIAILVAWSLLFASLAQAVKAREQRVELRRQA